MAVLDPLKSWYISRIILPKVWVLDNPGFVIASFTKGPVKVFARELFLPENLFAELERRIVKEYSKRGGQYLYSSGKKFGFSFAKLSNFPTAKNTSEKELMDFGKVLLMFINGTWGQKIEDKTDFKKRTLELVMDDYMICSKNGIGHLLTEGGIGGIWSYILNDSTLEGVQIKCQGRGDKECFSIWGPASLIKQKGGGFSETDLERIEDKKKYMDLNSIRRTTYAKYSIKQLIDGGVFKYINRWVEFGGQRYLPCESSLLYIIESEFKKLENKTEILFDIAYSCMKGQAESLNNKNYQKFITDFVSALGFGDVFVTKDKKFAVHSNFFPWVGLADKVDFSLYRGMVSGLLSGFTGTEIKLRKYKSSFLQGYMSLSISE